MSQFSDILQELVNMSYDELLGMAKVAVNELRPVLRPMDKKCDGLFLILCIFFAAIGADNEVTALEKKFVIDALEIDEDLFNDLYSQCDKRVEDLIFEVTKKISRKHQSNLVTLVAAVTACDETINREEAEYISKLLLD
ncbi:MAG: hypothetical protein E7563_03595 [Ruminococcaceae bacterium]|nr:hypothetical protein [Oscillospiraceae bacterium]